MNRLRRHPEAAQILDGAVAVVDGLVEDALAVLGEAMAVHLTVLNRAPDEAYRPEIYRTELAQSQVLERLGRTEEAARVASLARSDHLAELPGMLRNQSGGWAGPPATR